MDKEMMEKVEEFMKANGRRELNMEEADHVSGGAVNFINGNAIEEEDFNNFYYELTKHFGFYVAYDYLCKSTGFHWVNEVYPGVCEFPRNVNSDMEKMSLILFDFWQIVKND